MRLYEEILKSVDGASISRCILVPNGGGYFEGVKSVEDFSPQRIVLRFSQGQTVIEGVGLFIKKYCDGDLEILGKINAFYLLKDGEAIAAAKPSASEYEQARQ